MSSEGCKILRQSLEEIKKERAFIWEIRISVISNLLISAYSFFWQKATAGSWDLPLREVFFLFGVQLASHLQSRGKMLAGIKTLSMLAGIKTLSKTIEALCLQKDTPLCLHLPAVTMSPFERQTEKERADL